MDFPRIIRFVAFVAFLPVWGALPSSAADIKATLVAGHSPALRWVGQLSDTFIPSVDEALHGTGHSIGWDPQFGGGLAGVGQELETTAEGLADIGLVLSVFDPAKLAIQNVSYYTPFSTVDTTTILNVMEVLHTENPAFETPWTKNGLTYLGGGVGTADYILMTKIPVVGMDDLEGLKIGVAGPGATWLSGTGAIPVSGNLTTYATNLKSGVLDGAILPENAALPTKLYEVAPYILKAGIGAQYAGGIAANTEWYDRQPKIVKKALKIGARAYSKAFNRELTDMASDALAEMQMRGATLTQADPEFRKEWVRGMDNAAKLWAASLSGNGEGILATYMSALRAAGQNPLRDWDRN